MSMNILRRDMLLGLPGRIFFSIAFCEADAEEFLTCAAAGDVGVFFLGQGGFGAAIGAKSILFDVLDF
jgi:hypothetical protein